MSDPLAVSILAKLTSWYGFDGDLTDSHGPNPITLNTVVAGYQPGLHGQELMAGSQGSAVLASPFQFSLSGLYCIGGWMNFSGGMTQTTVFSLGVNAPAQNELLYSNSNAAGDFSGGSWVRPETNFNITFSGKLFKKYPFTVRVTDSAAQIGNSNQVISINTGSVQPGRYFIVVQWIQGQIRLYVDGIQRATVNVTTPRTDNVIYFQIGNQIRGSLTPCALEEVFFCQADALTDDEITWIYNADRGRSYAELVSLAS